MSEHTIDNVRRFHLAFGHPVAPVPHVPDPKQRMLRFRLLLEEVLEFGRATGIAPLCEGTEEEFRASLADYLVSFTTSHNAPVDLEEAADGLADIDYVCQGANLVFGFPAQEIAQDVHEANMSKLGGDGKPILDNFGKVVKGPNTRKPFTKQILQKYL